MTAADRQRRFTDKMKRRGLVRIWLYVPRRFIKLIRAVERSLREPSPKRETLLRMFDEPE